jgi:acyl-CoA reductase-like NAD-dependent aldehyde dehydrogenase
MDYAVRAAAFGIFFHQGQVCMANSRILVEEPTFDDSATALSRWPKARKSAIRASLTRLSVLSSAEPNAR